MAGITMPGDGVFHPKASNFPVDANGVGICGVEDSSGNIGLPAVQARRNAAGNWEEVSHVKTATLQNAVSATGNGTDFTVDGYGVATLQITGTFSATITFYGSVDGANFINIAALNRNDGTRVLSTTAAGLYEIDCRGLQKIRAAVTWTSGTSVTVVGRAEPFAGSNTSLQLTGRKAALIKTTTTTELIANEGIFVGETVGFTATYVPLDVSQYKDKIIQIKNNHDVAIRVAVYWAHPVSAGTTSIITIWDTSTPTVAAGANFRMFPEALPSGSNASSRNASKDLQMPITGLGIFLSRTSAPGSGNVVIDVFGGAS